MSMVECSMCSRTVDSRSARACRDCGGPLCEDCERLNKGYCEECRDKGWD